MSVRARIARVFLFMFVFSVPILGTDKCTEHFIVDAINQSECHLGMDFHYLCDILTFRVNRETRIRMFVQG